MGRYQSTAMGDAIVSLGTDSYPVADVLRIALAEAVLLDHRRSAWSYAEQCNCLADTFLSAANELADALAVAADQRAKFADALERRAVA